MDPNAALSDIRALFRSYEADEIYLPDLNEKFNALDNWLSNGGCLPDAWATAPDPDNFCDWCAKGEHTFDALNCLCCGVEKVT